MKTQVNKIVLPGNDTIVEVSFDGDVVTAVSINDTPVIVSPDLEKGDIVVKHGGTRDAYMLTDSFDTVRRWLKLLE